MSLHMIPSPSKPLGHGPHEYPFFDSGSGLHDVLSKQFEFSQVAT